MAIDWGIVKKAIISMDLDLWEKCVLSKKKERLMLQERSNVLEKLTTPLMST